MSNQCLYNWNLPIIQRDESNLATAASNAPQTCMRTMLAHTHVHCALGLALEHLLQLASATVPTNEQNRTEEALKTKKRDYSNEPWDGTLVQTTVKPWYFGIQ